MSTPPPEESVDDISSEDVVKQPAPYRTAAEPIASTDFPDQGPLIPGGALLRLMRLAFWTVWFFALPLLLACVFVWALTPAIGLERGDVVGFVESFVREQPVPVGIIAFTLFEIL